MCLTMLKGLREIFISIVTNFQRAVDRVSTPRCKHGRMLGRVAELERMPHGALGTRRTRCSDRLLVPDNFNLGTIESIDRQKHGLRLGRVRTLGARRISPGAYQATHWSRVIRRRGKVKYDKLVADSMCCMSVDDESELLSLMRLVRLKAICTPLKPVRFARLLRGYPDGTYFHAFGRVSLYCCILATGEAL